MVSSLISCFDVVCVFPPTSCSLFLFLSRCCAYSFTSS